jgi:two-component system, NarL family, nitrate/nitrite response regulator NarL
MGLILYSNSQSLIAHLSEKLESPLEVQNELSYRIEAGHLLFLHITSFGTESIPWIRRMATAGLNIAVCSDRPDIGEMLSCVQAGCKAYCNSYMQIGLYQQMIQQIVEGQSWFPPQMLEQTFSLAQSALGVRKNSAALGELTERENEVAHAVAEGLSNKQIADRCDISERTVKAHMTNIFKKLDIKDRVALVLYFK